MKVELKEITHDCPECHSVGSVFWFIAQPPIWKCEACGTLHTPQEVQGVSRCDSSRHKDLSDNREAIASFPVVTNAFNF